MKKSTFCGLFVALIVMGGSVTVKAAVALDDDLKAALPSGQFFLPAPPEVGSLVWQDDSVKYFQYKEASRKWDEEKQEMWDSVWAKMNEQYYFALYRLAADSVMNAPFITNVSWTKNAKTGKYTVSYTRNTTDFPKMNDLELLCEQMKEDGTGLWRTRMRPYCYFGDWYAGKKYAKGTANATSYPSGHGYFAGLFGLAMLYIDPDHSLAIKKMMDEWLNCRLILGAHWNTDLNAGQHLGAMTFAIAMNYPQFKNAVEAAKAELKAYRDKSGAPARIPDDKTNGRNLEQTQAFVTSKLNAWKDSAQTMDLEITRTFYCDGYYNSMSLPFDIAKDDWVDSEKNPLAGGTLKRFDKAEVIDDVLTITITTDTSVIAGVPYLISFPEGEDIVNPVFKGIQVTKALGGSTPADAMNCNGTFVPCDLPKGQDGGYLVLGTNNSLYWPGNDQEYLRGFRAYFKANDTQAGAAIRKAKSAQLSEKTMPTGDSSIAEFTNSQIYKLIDDGQVIIIRDGVKYGIDGMVR